MANQIIWPGKEGNAVGRVTPLLQAATLEAITILATKADGTSIDLSAYTLSATLKAQATGTVTAVTGTLTPANGSFTWTPSAADVATAGIYYLQVTYTSGALPWTSFETPIRIGTKNA